ncbi:hypothetical protein [Paenibacillus campi]|uniref:hypothetical protein n=1 Tax=Paenibacillus campi TaxID=3106031 RepID=UPI002AFF2C40|nr:hypothetical protein [Paenibacillus sp. SGZ-1014]
MQPTLGRIVHYKTHLGITCAAISPYSPRQRDAFMLRKVTRRGNGAIPTLGFDSGDHVLVDGVEGVVVRSARDKSWIDVRFAGWSKRLHWNEDKQEHFGKKDITPTEG